MLRCTKLTVLQPHCISAELYCLQVLYLDVAPGQASEQLQRLGEAVISHFCAQGSEIVVVGPGRGFTPHVTVAKTSKLLGGRHKPKRGGCDQQAVCQGPQAAHVLREVTSDAIMWLWLTNGQRRATTCCSHASSCTYGAQQN
jgi:hypothetical protein